MFKRGPDLKKLMERQDVQELVKLLQTASEQMRGEIVQILVDMRDPKATEALMREAESANLSIRKLAAQALTRIDPERKYIAAVHMLNDVHRQVRTTAMSILATLGNPRAIDALAKTLEKERDPQARAAAAHAIGVLKDRRGVQPLIDALDDVDARVRMAAAEGLGLIGDRMALSELVKMHASESDPDTRASMEYVIGKLQ